MKSLLSEILDGEVKILEYPRTKLKVKTVSDKAKVSDCIIKLNDELVHLELETGLETKVKNLSNFFNIYSQNATRGDKYDTKTKFITLWLQFGEGKKDYLIDEYRIKNEKEESLIDKIIFKKINVDKIKSFWYSKDEINIEKYKYIIMLDLEREELKKLGSRDEIVAKFNKEITELNDSPQFIALMSREEEQRKLANTREALAFENGTKQKSIEIPKSMLQDNESVEKIMKYTHLSINEINALK